MRKALTVYHILNVLHVVFYGYIMIRALNIGNARALIQGNSRIILIIYALTFIGLSYLAKKLGDGMDNPIRTVKWARILHYSSLAIFVLSFLLYYKYNPSFIYLMILSY